MARTRRGFRSKEGGQLCAKAWQGEVRSGSVAELGVDREDKGKQREEEGAGEGSHQSAAEGGKGSAGPVAAKKLGWALRELGRCKKDDPVWREEEKKGRGK